MNFLHGSRTGPQSRIRVQYHAGYDSRNEMFTASANRVHNSPTDTDKPLTLRVKGCLITVIEHLMPKRELPSSCPPLQYAKRCISLDHRIQEMRDEILPLTDASRERGFSVLVMEMVHGDPDSPWSSLA